MIWLIFGDKGPVINYCYVRKKQNAKKEKGLKLCECECACVQAHGCTLKLCTLKYHILNCNGRDVTKTLAHLIEASTEPASCKDPHYHREQGRISLQEKFQSSDRWTNLYLIEKILNA